jgi:hypothetical protein
MGVTRKECIHKVPSGAHITEEKDGTTHVRLPDGSTSTITPCGHKLVTQRHGFGQYDGWLAYVTYESPSDFDSFFGYFSVPYQPEQTPEVLYLFTGLQNVDWIPIIDPEPDQFDIIQPVLQYPGDNGNYWSVKSWYVTLTNDVVVSDEIQVNVGDSIYGNMTRLGEGSSTWYIGGTDVQSSQTTEITVTRDLLATQPWAYCTAECYGCDGGCSYEPTNTIQFTKLQLFYKGQQITPTWTPSVSPNPMCHEHAVVQDPATVTISFQQS